MPLKEYPTEETLKGQKVRIELKSEQYDKADGSLFDKLCVAPKMKDDTDKIEVSFTSEAFLNEDDSTIKLSYTESAITEMDGTVTCLTFFKNENDKVLVERRGKVNSAFYIKEGVRNISNYSTPFGPLDIATHGTNVSVSFKGSLGLVKLDYIVELHGMTAQRTRMTIKICKTTKD